MYGYFWNTVLAVNSIIWFVGLGYFTYAAGMLIIALDWRQFLFALTVFVILSLIELVLDGLAHD